MCLTESVVSDRQLKGLYIRLSDLTIVFSDWSEQHSASQTKKDGGDTNGTTGNRRYAHAYNLEPTLIFNE